MKTERLPTRDVRENRAERQEKLGQALETLPGKTLRDRRPNSRRTNGHDEGRGANRVVNEPVMANVGVPVTGGSMQKIWFRLNAPSAARVCVAGTFNDWNPSTTPLLKHNDGEWRIQKDLPPGTYEYRFVVDGVWQEDSHAKHTVPNPFGGRNSVVFVV